MTLHKLRVAEMNSLQFLKTHNVLFKTNEITYLRLLSHGFENEQVKCFLEVKESLKKEVIEITDQFTMAIFSDFFSPNKSNSLSSLIIALTDYYEKCIDILKIKYRKLNTQELIFLNYNLAKWTTDEVLLKPFYNT